MSEQQKVKLVEYPECDLADHEEYDGGIRQHWHCKYIYETPCLEFHATEEEANNCEG